MIRILLSFLMVIPFFTIAQSNQELPPPNILWISWEDVGPQLGCYGDSYADTPNLDRLASQGVLYQKAYANYPVCAPARTGIITGMFPSSYGGQHMQCRTIPPQEVRLFPQYLREAGYYCTNDSKDHYQMAYDPDIVWDQQQKGARWHGRTRNQPFFSVINFNTTHEGHSRTQNFNWVKEVRSAIGNRKHDHAEAPLPPYFPDTEDVRDNVALYYDNMTYTDSVVGEIFNQLKAEGLWDNTIVFFWGDHGWGLSRGKRWPYESGLRVPLIIRVPEKYEPYFRSGQSPGTETGELVSFLDFAPTMLSLAGIQIPDYMQGRAIIGPQQQDPPRQIFVGRDRMDETYELMRGVITDDYLYLRNYRPFLPYVQTVRTMERQSIMQDWRRLYQENKLNQEQSLFFQYPKPAEELYDLKADPHQINNLAGSKKHSKILQELRQQHLSWAKNVGPAGDVGLIPEAEFDQMKWPDGDWPKTGKPYFTTENRNYWNGEIEINIEAPTPGSTIAWRFRGEEKWRIYQQPIALSPGRILEAKASRLGFYTSPVVTYRLGQESAPGEDPASDYWPWQELVNEKDLLPQILDVKSLDLESKAALNGYYEYLENPSGTIRYWATQGIRNHSKSNSEKEKAIAVFKNLLNDDSEIVVIEAAHGLCQWGNYDLGIPLLRAALDHRQASVRLYALNVLDKMGQKAEMALPFPEIPLGTANNYTHRIYIRIYKRLGIKPRDLEYATPEQVRDIQGVYNTIILENQWDYQFPPQ